jgi:flap endonuclease-1
MKLLFRYAAYAIRNGNLVDYKGMILAIDVSIFLYKSLCSNGDMVSYFCKMICRLLENGISPVFVFDGKPPKEKIRILEMRRKNRAKQSEKIVELQKQLDELKMATATSTEIRALTTKIAKKKRNRIYVTRDHVRDCKLLFDMMGVPYIQANGEAEALCAYLCRRGLAHGCITDDSDALANGAPFVLSEFHPDKNTVVETNLSLVLATLKLDYAQFIDMCILCGCDYTSSISGIGYISALSFIREHKSIEAVIKFISSDCNCESTKCESTDTYDKKEQKTHSKYVIPDDFDFVRARQLFNECGCDHDIKMQYNMHITAPNGELQKFLYSKSRRISQFIVKKTVRLLTKAAATVAPDDKSVERKVEPVSGSGSSSSVSVSSGDSDVIHNIIMRDPAIIAYKLSGQPMMYCIPGGSEFQS